MNTGSEWALNLMTGVLIRPYENADTQTHRKTIVFDDPEAATSQGMLKIVGNH